MSKIEAEIQFNSLVGRVSRHDRRLDDAERTIKELQMTVSHLSEQLAVALKQIESLHPSESKES